MSLAVALAPTLIVAEPDPDAIVNVPALPLGTCPAPPRGGRQTQCGAEAGSRSTVTVWPPMPAPSSCATATLVVSEEVDVCAVFQVVGSLSAAAADESALSLSVTALSAVWCAVTLV